MFTISSLVPHFLSRSRGRQESQEVSEKLQKWQIRRQVRQCYIVLEIPFDKGTELWDQLWGMVTETVGLFAISQQEKKILWANCFFFFLLVWTSKMQETKALAEQYSLKRSCRWADKGPSPRARRFFPSYMSWGQCAQFIFPEQGTHYPNVQTPDLCHLSHVSYLYRDTQQQGETAT